MTPPLCRFFTALTLTTLVPLIGCSKPSETPDSQASDTPPPITVIATNGMIADLARRIGGSNVQVESLIGEGIDPHLYQPTRDDVTKMLASDVILYNGLLLEGNMDDALKAARPPIKVVAVAESIPQDQLLFPADGSGHPDPHVWLDPALWGLCSQGVVEVFTELRPTQAAEFQANQKAFLNTCQGLTTSCRDTIDAIPPEHRLLITSHDAFQYFGRVTGLEVYGVQGISTESEAGLADIEALVELISQRGIPAVFIESSVPPRSVEALVEGARARGAMVQIGGELYADSMGAPDTPAGTWPGMIQHNLTTISNGLAPSESAKTDDGS